MSATFARRLRVLVGTMALVVSAGCSSGSDAEGDGEDADVAVTTDADGDVFTDAGGSSTAGGGAGANDVGDDSDDRSDALVTGAAEEDADAEADDEFTERTDSGGDDDGEIEQVPADEVETIGTPPPTFVYTEEVEPAETLAATLCNLNAPFIRSLRTADDSGTPVVDEGLRLAVVSLRDSVQLWEGLELSFPDVADDVDTAREVEELWSAALAADAAGEVDTAQSLMVDADAQIGLLPDVGPDEIDSCES